ncbi:hypothetical protein BDA99DRAFT_575602 [Phascolomyces articulosus]|uniref:No apical meristem-associated C-terminal domain-containing protein n=1 Tax=Phascolomyces articulosus TaxID=60185 RepID=A0AAD5P980_9FUNG|nr:hypothetical protein BDA99DRAFT_575602 [Phascolomyces articulosus]
MPPKTSSAPKKQRSNNFTSVEDQQVCVLWNENINSPEGVNRKSETYWEDVAKHYNVEIQHEDEGLSRKTKTTVTFVERDAKGLKKCWTSNISPQVLLFCDYDVKWVDALQLCEMAQGHEFQFEQCWSYIKVGKKLEKLEEFKSKSKKGKGTRAPASQIPASDTDGKKSDDGNNRIKLSVLASDDNTDNNNYDDDTKQMLLSIARSIQNGDNDDDYF